MITKLIASVFPRFVFFLIVLAAGHNLSPESFGEFSLYQTRILAVSGVISYYCQYRFKLFQEQINAVNYILTCFVFSVFCCFFLFLTLSLTGLEFEFIVLLTACVANSMYLLLSYLVVFLTENSLSIFNRLSAAIFLLILILCFFSTDPIEIIIVISTGNIAILFGTLLSSKFQECANEFKIIENFKYIGFDFRVFLIATLGLPVIAVIQSLLVNYQNGIVVVGQIFFCIQFLNVSNVFIQRYCQIISPQIKTNEFFSLYLKKYLVIVSLFHSLIFILLLLYSTFVGGSSISHIGLIQICSLAFFSIFTSVNFFTTEKLNIDGDVSVNFISNVIWAVASFFIFFTYSYFGGDIFLVFISSIYLSRIPALIYQYVVFFRIRAVINNE